MNTQKLSDWIHEWNASETELMLTGIGIFRHPDGRVCVISQRHPKLNEQEIKMMDMILEANHDK